MKIAIEGIGKKKNISTYSSVMLYNLLSTILGRSEEYFIPRYMDISVYNFHVKLE